jgi:hypothetical protein
MSDIIFHYRALDNNYYKSITYWVGRSETLFVVIFFRQQMWVKSYIYILAILHKQQNQNCFLK